MTDIPTYHRGQRNYGTGYDMMDRIERLECALALIAEHRAKCHAHDKDMGHELRDFDIDDVIIMEHAARIALKDTDT